MVRTTDEIYADIEQTKHDLVDLEERQAEKQAKLVALENELMAPLREVARMLGYKLKKIGTESTAPSNGAGKKTVKAFLRRELSDGPKLRSELLEAFRAEFGEGKRLRLAKHKDIVKCGKGIDPLVSSK